jgi:Uncharacterized protein conserved in bacteria (DUF2188)
LANKPVHIVPNPDKGWNVEREGASRASRHCDTQSEAIDVGRNIAQRDKTELSIHGRDGKIRQKDSYGNDPCPPRDKR